MRRTALPVVLLLTSLSAEGGTVTPPPSEPFNWPAGDYSSTQLFGSGDPENLNWMLQLATTLGPNAFLSFGNIAYSSSSQPASVAITSNQAAVPEPRSLFLFGFGLLIAMRRKAMVQV